MMTRRQASVCLLSVGALAGTGTAALETKIKELPPARTTGGKPLTEALWLRRSTREYSTRSVDLQVLSGLL